MEGGGERGGEGRIGSGGGGGGGGRPKQRSPHPPVAAVAGLEGDVDYSEYEVTRGERNAGRWRERDPGYETLEEVRKIILTCGSNY